MLRFAPLLLVIMLGSSCTEAFKKKFAAGREVGELYGAGVTVGTSSSASAGEGSRSATTLTLSGLKPEQWTAADAAPGAGLVAYRFVKKLQPEDLKGDTHVDIKLELVNGKSYEYGFPVADLYALDKPVEIAEKFFKAATKHDTSAVWKMLDEQYFDDQAYVTIDNLLSYTDSIHAGAGKREMKLMGIAFTKLEDVGDPVVIIGFMEQPGSNWTRYKLYIKRTDHKIVSLDMRSSQGGVDANE